MLFLGHLGIGHTMAKPLSQRLNRPPLGWVLLGCCLPDLIDKPLYYGLSWTAGLQGEALGLISGTRTFGHSGVFLLFLLSAGFFGSRVAAGLALGMATHIVLDFGVDVVESSLRQSATLQAFLFPIWGPHFARTPFHGLEEHLAGSFSRLSLLLGEAVGGTLLLREWRSTTQRAAARPLPP